MKLFAIFSLCIIGVAYSATLNRNPQCSVCKSALDWVRSNENVLNSIKTDELVSNDFLELLESDTATEDICGLFLMCQMDKGENHYLTVLRGGGGHGGHGGRGKGHGKGKVTHGKPGKKHKGKKVNKNKNKDHKKKRPKINVDPGQQDCSNGQC